MKIDMQEVAKFEFLAVHYNPSPPLAAGLEGVEHAHTFQFTCKRKLSSVPKSWSANNLREDCVTFIQEYFADHRQYGILNFEGNDCISLAELLIAKLKLDYCSVSEQGVGGVELQVSDDMVKKECGVVIDSQVINRIFGPQGPQ